MLKVIKAFKLTTIFKNWPTLFCDYLGLIKNKKIFYYLRNDVKYSVRAGTQDKDVINEIWLVDAYTPKGFELKDNDTVIDIGAQIGVFSVFASKHAKHGKIFAFEPLPENFQFLNKNKSYNHAKNIITINKAVSDNVSKKDLFIDTHNTGAHSFFSEFNKSPGKKIRVKTISLDAFVKEQNIKRIDFLKMDCEGAEYEILFGSSKNTISMIKKISMEYHDIDKAKTGKKLKTFLEKNGFHVKIEYPMLYAKRN